MNTNHLKKFAQEARRKLLEQIGAKLSFVLTTDSAELREKTEHLKQLREELSRTTKEQLIEKVAYTWFNRLMALRFMDVNDYQPLGIRIVTPKDGYTIPEILDEAKRGNISDELKTNRQKIYDLLDNKIPSTNAQNEVFKELLIAACNHLNTTFPFLFERINDYTELLLPDDLTSDFSIIKSVRDGMPKVDCKNVEIIGWLYQFYISEKKDEVFASKSKVKKEDIPAATQLFTPRWIVEYMVQNTLGKLWLQNRPKSKLREHMPYFIESEPLKSEEYLIVDSPEEIEFLDPACGSGHILVYAFDLLTKIYEEEGYSITDIPKLILEKNLNGFEIDERAAQLSGLALMMKARGYHHRVFREDINPNILCYKDIHLDKEEISATFSSLNIESSSNLIGDLMQLLQATNYGSLLLPNSNIEEIKDTYKRLIQLASIDDVFIKRNINELLDALYQLQKLSQSFHCIVTNPPYMSSGDVNDDLSNWIKRTYPKSKVDMYSCFIERSLYSLSKYGYCGLVTMEGWMFLSSYEEFRKEIIRNTKIHSLTHFGWHIMRIAFGTVSFILQKSKPNEGIRSTYSFLEISDIDKSTDRPFTFPIMENGRFNITNQMNFEKIPSCALGYWLSEKMISLFPMYPELKDIAELKQGMATTNNSIFMRNWFEVSANKIHFLVQSREEALQSKKKWFPYSKGGALRKWYGNNDYVVNFENDGKTICDYIDNTPNVRVKSNGRVINRDYYFKEALTWSLTSSSGFGVRYRPSGFIFDVNGMSLFHDNPTTQKNLIYLLNSKVSYEFLKVINPTLAFQKGDIEKIPVADGFNQYNPNYDFISKSKEDWDSHETSWDFTQNELIRIAADSHDDIEEVVELYKQYWKIQFVQLHRNEEELNRKFIEIYGLKEEMTPTVLLEDINLQQNALDAKKLLELNKELDRDQNTGVVLNYDEIELPFIEKEIIEQFISYSVGCIFGRYSLDKNSLVISNPAETLQDYFRKISKSENECTFLPDNDNIIPFLDNEWFEDDIVGRFCHFLKTTFGENNFSKNLVLIEEKVGKSIRNYFIKDFYPNHIKRYKKRPIYFMFSSPKGSFNVLIYMHRYTSDTVSNILNKYLKEFMGKLNTRKEHLQHVQVSGSASDKTKAIKEIDSTDKMLVELHEYERDILYPLATERKEIDLDDGVLVNYNKFGKAVKEISGLNDKKTKDKVRKFDWIDTTQIR